MVARSTNGSLDVAQALLQSLRQDLVSAEELSNTLYERLFDIQRQIDSAEDKIVYLKAKIEQFTDQQGQLRLPMETQEYARYATLEPYEAAKRLLQDQPTLTSKEAADLLIKAGVKFNGKHPIRMVNIARTNMMRTKKPRRSKR